MRKSRSYVNWTADRVAFLTEGYKQGRPVPDIAADLGISHGAVVGTAHRLGLRHPRATWHTARDRSADVLAGSHDGHMVALLLQAASEARASGHSGRANLLTDAAIRIEYLAIKLAELAPCPASSTPYPIGLATDLRTLRSGALRSAKFGVPPHVKEAKQ